MPGLSDAICIAIDARPLAGPPCGYTVYLASIIRCLRADDICLTLLSNQPLLPRYADILDLELRIFSDQGALHWEQGEPAPPAARAMLRPIFVVANRGIPIRKSRTTHYLLGLLDIILYLYWRDYLLKPVRSGLSRRWVVKQTLSQPIALARADSIFTISRRSAADITRVFGRAAAVFPIRLPQVDAIDASETRPHFAYIGGVDCRKRVDVLLEAFAAFSKRHPGYRLTLIGNNMPRSCH